MSTPLVSKDSLPKSATHSMVAYLGITTLLGCLAWIKWVNPFNGQLVYSTLLLLLIPFVSMTLLDLAWQKVYRRPTTGLCLEQYCPNPSRTLTKYLGLLGTVGSLYFIYWLFPEYHGKFYNQFYELTRLAVPIWLLLALPYFFWVDSKMIEPEDGYWQVGLLITGRFHQISWPKLTQHGLGWLIKGYFFPLMFTYTTGNLDDFLRTNYSFNNLKATYDFLYFFLFFIDVILASMGYFISMRIFDNHLRSAEPTASGWLVAIICYEPFWSMINQNYLKYHNDVSWGSWLSPYPIWYTIWGCLIILCIFIYIWATVMFGTRFSNLTHRGILTNGPYRWTKHPAYISKNISWWLIAIPFLADKPWDINLRACLLLAGLNLIYFARAKTEERHLSQDSTYVAYMHWISKYGLVAKIKNLSIKN